MEIDGLETECAASLHSKVREDLISKAARRLPSKSSVRKIPGTGRGSGRYLTTETR